MTHATFVSRGFEKMKSKEPGRQKLGEKTTTEFPAVVEDAEPYFDLLQS